MKVGNQNPQRQMWASTLESCSIGLEKQSKKVGSPKNQLCHFPDKKSFLCCQWQLLFRRILFCSCKWKEPRGSQPAAQLLNLPMKTLRKRGKFARKQLCKTARQTMCPLRATETPRKKLKDAQQYILCTQIYQTMQDLAAGVTKARRTPLHLPRSLLL